MTEREEIERLIQPVLDTRDLLLVDIVVRGERGGKVLEVFLDSDKGISADDCASVSRELLPIIGGLASFSTDYTLTVSSPGLDRPLRHPRQYLRHVGRQIRLTVKTDEGMKQIEGELDSAGDSMITLKDRKGIATAVLLQDVVEARIVPRW